MALLLSTLEGNLVSMVPTGSYTQAAERLATAFGDYTHDAVANGVRITTASVDSIAVPAMEAAIDFSTADSANSAATTIMGGINAFWAAMVAAPTSFFTGATVITPPSYGTLIADMESVFEDSVLGEYTLETWAEEFAGVIHPQTISQGTATFPGPIIAPIL